MELTSALAMRRSETLRALRHLALELWGLIRLAQTRLEPNGYGAYHWYHYHYTRTVNTVSIANTVALLVLRPM